MIILAGGGGADQSKKVDEKLKETVGMGGSILYIPTALRGSDLYTECYDWFTNIFSDNNFNIDMWKQLQDKDSSDIPRYDAVYIGGGNTFMLSSELQKSGIAKELKTFHEHGVLYGGSAGAIICGNLLDASRADKDGYEEQTHGINLLSDWSVWPHYTAKEEQKVQKFVNKHDTKVIATPEETGIEVEGTQGTVIGTKPATMFTPKRQLREIQPKETLQFD